MWSSDFNGRHSVFDPQQRVLFPVRDGVERTKKNLLRALQYGTCTGVALLNVEDRRTLQAVKQTLQTVYTKNTQLHRSDFVFVCTMSPTWAIESAQDRVRDVLGYLGIEKLDVLLLPRPPTLTSDTTTSQRKHIVLRYWDMMCEIKRRELVREIGLSDFKIQEMEFIFTASPRELPTLLSLELGLPDSSALPMRTTLGFAHGRRMDVITRFAYKSLDSNASQLAPWRQVAQSIAARQRSSEFDIAVVHEAEVEPYHVEKRDMKETATLQTPTEIILRYLIQKGIVVVPLPDSDEDGTQFTDEETHEIFYNLVHPFSSLPAQRSPQVQYSRILTKEDLHAIDVALPLAISFPES